MQISTKGNGNLVRVYRGSSYPGFKLTRLYCNYTLKKNKETSIKMEMTDLMNSFHKDHSNDNAKN